VPESLPIGSVKISQRRKAILTARTSEAVGAFEELLIWYKKHQTTKKRCCKSIKPDLSRQVPGSAITLDD
jgi:hypothetical protein